jgi:hypothetical protein
MIVANFKFGDSEMLYSTASVLFAGKIGARDVLFLHGDMRHAHEATIHLNVAGSSTLQHDHPLVSLRSDANGIKKSTMSVTFLPGIDGLITVWDNPTQLVLYADSTTAGTFWAPELGGSGDFASFWGLGTNASVLVGGPYLVRNAALQADGAHLALTGDLVEDVRLFVFAPPGVRTISWNGMLVAPDMTSASGLTAHGGAFVSTLRTRTSALVDSISVPKLRGWKYADSLPEIKEAFDDANWTDANHTKTNIPFKPYYGDGTVLYGCDYGL